MAWQISIPMRDIEEFCHKWRINRMWIFGSALRDDLKRRGCVSRVRP